MAFNDLELKRCEKAVGKYVESRRPPPHIRPQLDLSYRIQGQGVEIFEVRPAFNDPSVTIENCVAKATYVKRAQVWRVYWRRADLKWHRYGPRPNARSIEEFLKIVEEDEFRCFYG